MKAKIRAAAFRRVSQIEGKAPEALVWVLPLIFHVGTAADDLTENVLILYSQTNKRVSLSVEQQRYVENINESDEVSAIFVGELPKIASEEARKALYDIALTTAAVNLKPQKEHEECLSELAKHLRVEYKGADLKEKVRYFGN